MNMKTLFVLVSLALLASVSATNVSTSKVQKFAQCMLTEFNAYTKSLEIIFSSQSSLYMSILQSNIHNNRWLNITGTANANPLLIVTPFHESEIRAAIICSRKNDLQVRVRSGGHDYEGLSYLCRSPYIIIDLVNYRAIEVDIANETAWVQSGTTLGELYYAIAQKSPVHGFPAGLCPTVGVGGHFSGGGFGTLLRKYGLAADNVVDAYLVDVNGRILDRAAMGEDLFWSIRGGGGTSFGVILSWKIKLVRVPRTVTVFNLDKTVEQGATKLVHKWQCVADKLPEDLFIRIIIQNVGGENITNPKTVQASFNSLFLGEIDRLIPLVNETFPELGLQPDDCTEMSWIESTVYFAGFQSGSPLEKLLDKNQLYQASFKAKTDYVTIPISEEVLEGLWKRLLEEELVFIIMDPYGGKMSEIPESGIPFPHRQGNLYNIQYLVKWDGNAVKETKRHLQWIKMLYIYMKPFVSNSPRAAYVNYRDLDIGTNKQHDTRDWGLKYFKGNFKRLVMVKSKVDPDNFFRNEQSIPTLQT